MEQVVDASPAEAVNSPLEEVQLRARWLEDDADGESRRDAVLAALRARRGETGPGEALDLRGISLIGEDLSEIDLSGCNLANADLSEADLRRANLSRCDLTGTSLFRANLDGCELLGTTLAGANLSECTARRAGFGFAKMQGANFFHAVLEGATLSGAVLPDADLRATNLEHARLREADLTHVNFDRAKLRGADLGKSDVRRAQFGNTDLRETRLRALKNFKTANWVGADIRDVDFAGAYLLRRHIMDENYLFEFRSQSRYARCIYALWMVTSNCGRSLLPWILWNLVVALSFGVIYSMVSVDFGEHRTWLSPYYYSFVTLTTLGYGDVVPASSAAQVAATVEVLLGYVGLGGLLSLLANKMARRAD